MVGANRAPLWSNDAIYPSRCGSQCVMAHTRVSPFRAHWLACAASPSANPARATTEENLETAPPLTHTHARA